MVAAYNRSQIIKGTLLLLGGLLCYGIAWLFFSFALIYFYHAFRLPYEYVSWLAFAALLVITWSGYRHWQKGDGFKSYVESSLLHNLGEGSVAAVVTDYYGRRITGPAYVLSQTFLGGPLLILRGLKHFQQRIPDESGLETKLHHALSVLRAANKWQAISEYPDMRPEILMLAQMRKIDFSAHKGTPRIKAGAA
jgi:hypothetical protein